MFAHRQKIHYLARTLANKGLNGILMRRDKVKNRWLPD